MAAMEFLVRVGETTKTDRNEFILASDTLGVSALVDLLHNRDNGGTTTSSLLGPFYINGERMQPLEVGGDLIGDNEGERRRGGRPGDYTARRPHRQGLPGNLAECRQRHVRKRGPGTRGGQPSLQDVHR